MAECSEVDVLTVTTTVASRDDAVRLGRGLVDEKLAACVQVEPIAASIYRWQGRLCEEPEFRLTIKSVPSRLDAIQAFFRDHHPYDVPQFVVMPCRASAAYGDWVRSETA